jgi:hypothetical protein
VTGSSAEAIEKLARRAKERNSSYTPPAFEQYYVVDVPPGLGPDVPAAIAKAISRLTVVEQATIEGRPLPPPSPVGACVPHQLQLKIAPFGIDAEFAWTHAGGKGELQGFVDIERGWGMTNGAGGGLIVAHTDLQVPPIPLSAGLNHDFERHGSRTLGVVAAQPAPAGVIGITPNLQSIACVGQWRPAPGDSVDPINDIAGAIAVAADSMQPGHVLLLEAQTEFNGLVNVPVETEPLTRDAIEVATSSGIVVIEAAGNGNVNIDPLLTADSGAILVAAADPIRRAKMTQSNFGTRVHCYAWGEQVVTTDYHVFNPFNAYTMPCGPHAPFDGTSSAAAILAGAALAVQGMAHATRGCRLAPEAVRAILSDPDNGTASAPGAQIGVMPDLRKIITQVIDTAALNAFPCV